MANTIKCKNCGNEIEVSEALAHQIEEQLLASIKEDHEKALNEAKKNAEEIVRKKIEEQIEIERRDRENENQELRKKNQELTEQLLEMGKNIRELKDADNKRELEMQKRLSEEMEKIRGDALKTAKEQEQGEKLALQKQIDDYKKMLDDANYKLTQKSQQLQGEVLELNLEKDLREAFPMDDISEVKKGAQGADIIHTVKGQSGRTAGIILWESKDAKWSPSWLAKLREDARQTGANISIIVCRQMPKDISNFTVMEGIIICSIPMAVPLASVLRREVLKVAAAKATAMNKDEKLEFLYEYMQSETFRHRFEAFAEGIVEMQNDLDTERRSMERIWKKREVQIKRMGLNAGRMYGELQGALGNALPEIKAFVLSDGVQNDI